MTTAEKIAACRQSTAKTCQYCGNHFFGRSFGDPDDGNTYCSDDCWEDDAEERADEARIAQYEHQYWMEEQGIYCDFADPGGRSALRAASEDNPRNRPCPNCGGENLLTPADVALGYQCDRCADQCERGGY